MVNFAPLQVLPIFAGRGACRLSLLSTDWIESPWRHTALTLREHRSFLAMLNLATHYLRSRRMCYLIQKKRKNPFHWTTFIILSCCGKNVRKEIYSKLNCHGQRELSEITMSLILFPTFYPPSLSSLHALMCTYSKASNLIHLPLSVSDLLTWSLCRSCPTAARATP